MNRFVNCLTIALAVVLISACATVPRGDSGSANVAATNNLLGMQAPEGADPKGAPPGTVGPPEGMPTQARGPFPVILRNLPERAYDPFNQLDTIGTAGNPESPIPDDLVEFLREEARRLPPAIGLQQIDELGPEQQGPAPAGVAYDSLDYRDCCGGGGNVPPDPELAVGPDHIIAVVNVAFAVYNKSGTRLAGPITFSSFFTGTPGCSATRVFDPNVLYDEEYDRFILGIDGNGTDYCVAATAGPDPLGSWHRYAFPTAYNGGEFFDYPHAGVGLDAIYMGANMFTGGFAGSRVWAMDKLDMYAGQPMTWLWHSTGFEDTPQPMNLHGWAQGSWPSAGPHYILTDGQFNGSTIGVWAWDDPFGANILVDTGTVSVSGFTGISIGMPVNVPQLGSTSVLENNDFRIQDAEYRNGDIWTVQTVACNPGSGTVNCIQWTRIDPTGPTILDAGVYASDGEFRIFSDVAANDCDDMAVGYTKSSAGMYPAVYVTGRKSSDTPGMLQAEVLIKAGERSYFSFDGSPYRWGDYTGMTVDPDGQTFWYLGEYSKNLTNVSANWGTYIGSFSFPDCTGVPQAPGKAGNPSPADNATGVDGDVVLSWSAGGGATAHRVYFDGVFQGEQSGTSFDPPGTLAAESVHTWRIDEKNDVGTTTGDTWTFTVAADLLPPEKASAPNPSDAATGVSVQTDLSWTAGDRATSHAVHFGPQGSNLAGPFNQGATTYDPGTLAYETSYEWRIDEVNDAGTTEGDVWSFTTESEPGPAGQASNPNPADSAIGVSGDVVLGWTAGTGAVSHDVYFDGDFKGNQSGTNYDPPGTLTPESSHTWRIDEHNSAGVVTTGTEWSFTVAAAPKFHVSSIDYSIDFGGGNRNRGIATVKVIDKDDAGVPGVAVSGTFSGDWIGTRSGTTEDPDGTVVLTTSPVKNGSFWEFCVDTASLAGWVHDTAASGVLLCSTPAPEGSITGMVTELSTGSPIDNASVTANSGQNTTTAADGSYTLSNVPVGTRTVDVSAAGYDPASNTVNVDEGLTSTLNFALTATETGGGTGTLRGTVTDNFGSKLGGVLVQVDGGPSATTNNGGKYSIQNVPAGLQTVTASLGGYEDETVVDVTITAGSTTTQDFSLTPPPP